MRRLHGTVLVMLMGGVWGCLAWQPAGPRRGSFSSAEVCGRCHRDILAAWKTSLHAQAADDTVFQDCLMDARKQFGEAVETRCLGCHAPTVAYSGDREMVTKVSWEGVTCDFCHSISQVELANRERPYRLQIGSTKFGPLQNALSRGHGVSFSRLHTDPVICAGCHDSRNEHGLMVLSTYSEWQESSFATERGSCLNCHMSPVKARVVDPKVLRLKDAPVNLHQMPGGHSVDQLNKALLARVVAHREGNGLAVQVFLRNRGAGHMIPTGSPLRKLVLTVAVDTGVGARLTAEREYRRVIVDAHGAELTDEAGVWLKGARAAADNRLKPHEERVETFAFAVPPGRQARIQAHLSYRYSPMESPETQRVSFLTVPAIVTR